MNVQRRFGLTLAALALAGLAPLSQAQDYPNKAISIIVPFAAGGPSDAHMRQFSAAMQRQLHQPLVIENVGGGSGNIGPARAAKSPADGYTLLQVNISFATAPALFKTLARAFRRSTCSATWSSSCRLWS